MKKRVNWAKDHPKKLAKAIADWDKNIGEATDNNGDPLEKTKQNLKVYAIKVGIPFDTLFKYVHPDAQKRRTLKGGVGRKSLMDLWQRMTSILLVIPWLYKEPC